MDKWKVCDQTMNQSEKILEIKDLCVEFQTVEGTVKAINHLNYTLHKGEKLGIVGPFEGSKPRRVLITRDDWMQMQLRARDLP